MREAEALRDAMKRSAFEGLRHIIRVKLRNRSLPHDGIPSTIPGRPGDDSACAVCAHGITTRDLMMVVITRLASQLSAPNKVTSVHLHADCFELWNEERRTFRPAREDRLHSIRPGCEVRDEAPSGGGSTVGRVDPGEGQPASGRAGTDGAGESSDGH